MNEVPGYLEEHIRQIPPGDCVVHGSTPVISFGDAGKAKVATLGLNPSKREFLNAQGDLLIGSQRRLATHRSLGYTALHDAPDSAVQQVLDDCNRYFQRNPYRRWFDTFAPILSACDASYYDQSACSLDLVQWATDPVWGNLAKGQREQLLTSGTTFLKRQLIENPSIGLVLANGRGVMDCLHERLALTFLETDAVVRFAVRDAALFTSRFKDGSREVPIIGWRVNLQSDQGAYGVTSNGIAELANRVGELYRNGC